MEPRVMDDPRNPEDLLPLRPVEFDVLLALAGGDAHGYGIIKEAEGRAGASTRMETGTLYRALRRLTRADLVQPTERRPAPELDDERRTYYAITPFGRSVASAEARRLEAQVDAARARALLSGAEAGGGGA